MTENSGELHIDPIVSTQGPEGQVKPISQRYSILSTPVAPEVREGYRVPWSTEWLLAEYTQATDGLIGKMDGTIPLTGQEIVHWQGGNNFIKEKVDLPPPDSVIYLDKSARPVQWMVRELWPILARQPGIPYDESTVPDRPNEHFLNIDKEDWLRRMGVPQEHLQDPTRAEIDFTKIDPQHLQRIRALYSTQPIDESTIDDAGNYPTIFDGKHVMIVDEVKSSGATLEIAQKLLSMAIPEATFSGQYWAEPSRIILNNGAHDKETGKQQFRMAWAPVWYNQESASGRGIGDRNPNWPKYAEEHGYHVSEVNKVGKYILSTPSHDPKTHELRRDTEADALRKDFKQLADDLRNHRILYKPSLKRSEKDFFQRNEAINAMTHDEWIMKRDQIAPKH